MTIEELEIAVKLKEDLDNYLDILQKIESCNGAEFKLSAIRGSGKEIFITKLSSDVKNLIKTYYQDKYNDCKEQIEKI